MNIIRQRIRAYRLRRKSIKEMRKFFKGLEIPKGGFNIFS